MMSTRDTNVIFRHLKSLKKFESLTKVAVKDQQSASTSIKPVNLLNVFFQSVFSINGYFEVKSIQTKKPRPTRFNVSMKKIDQIAVLLDVAKVRGPNGYSLIFCQRTAELMSQMNEPKLLMSNVKNNPKIWTIAEIKQIFLKEET